MTSKPKTEITHHQYLMALGLYTLGRQAYQKGIVAEDALAELLNREDRSDIGHISDAIYGDDKSFDKALELEGFIVLPPEQPK